LVAENCLCQSGEVGSFDMEDGVDIRPYFGSRTDLSAIKGVGMAVHATQSAEERAQIVLSLLRREEPASDLAKRHGISENTLYRWREEFITAGTSGLAPGKKMWVPANRLARLEAQIGDRDRVIGELTIANRSLKRIDPDNG